MLLDKCLALLFCHGTFIERLSNYGCVTWKLGIREPATLSFLVTGLGVTVPLHLLYNILCIILCRASDKRVYELTENRLLL